MPKNVTLAIEVKDRALGEQVQALAGAQSVQGKAFDGSGDVITLLVHLVPAILTPLTLLIGQALERRKHVRVVHKGTEIQGVSEETLRLLLEDERKAESKTSDEPVRASAKAKASPPAKKKAKKPAAGAAKGKPRGSTAKRAPSKAKR